MTEPRTPTGKRLAEGHDDRDPFVASLLAIEGEATAMERGRILSSAREWWAKDMALDPLATWTLDMVEDIIEEKI